NPPGRRPAGAVEKPPRACRVMPNPSRSASAGVAAPGGPCTMPPMYAADPGMSLVFIELGAVVVGLALLARLAHRLGFSAIPLYLLGGLAFGNGGLLPVRFSEEFV